MSGEATSLSNQAYKEDEADTSGENTGSMHVFVRMSTSTLFSADPVKVAKFLKYREWYELQIALKAHQVPSLNTAPKKASIDSALLKNLVWMRKIEAVALGDTVESLLSDQVKKYTRTLVYVSHRTDAETVKRALIGLQWPLKIDAADDRFTKCCSLFLELLENIGCLSLVDENTKQILQGLIK